MLTICDSERQCHCNTHLSVQCISTEDSLSKKKISTTILTKVLLVEVDLAAE